MKVTVIGTGYVGLVTGTCLAEFGFEVTCVDKDKNKIENLHKGIIPIYEPGLDRLVETNQSKKRLFFTVDLKEAVAKADVVFIAVGTPSDPKTGRADMQYVHAVAKEVAVNLKGYTVLVTKSTVPVGTVRVVTKLVQEANPSADFDVVSNPEFLREGSAIEDFMRPNRIVIGCDTKRAEAVMRELYRPLYLLETPMLFTNPESSELIKYAANAFLATKIAFINQMADLCEECGADVQAISKGMGLDHRIGSKFLHAGPGYGGSCFPKDTLALLQTGKDFNAEPTIVSAVVAANDERKRDMARKIIKACGGSVQGKKIAILGLTFKPNTDDMRDSPSLDIIPDLQKAGASIAAFDPQGLKEAQEHFTDIEYGQDAYDVMKNADALVIITEWNEFRALDLEKVKGLLKTPTVVDLRNVYPISEIEKQGLTYHSIGRVVFDPSCDTAVKSA
ncbi:MAG: UDP-glucose/GDP-mannose dehydrogenase family protein [Alphaproteobacteria bacterium]|nr:UDP-glucose/GDP-mannose dehydrogenase family protein [Alphaproteobacteria bacterium]NCQ66228.1 UDP-glucose/GDP-mannose dehydrogenase family protein [Alphaproteobacteria bacterium]NCT06576.1 UDP-glucose/GDP-mannose dehydrogenase family protein [Alphaproteobacteria bacterium]